MNEPFLTIIIPTCDRPDTLRHSLASCLKQDLESLEIIVSDNAGGPETFNVVQSAQDKRVRYIRTDKRLGMSEHWEFALSHAKGEWVSVVGDDDGFLPNGATDFHKHFSSCNCDAVVSATANFVWPRSGGGNGILLVKKIPQNQTPTQVKKSAPCIDQLLRGKLSHKELPWLYTGGFVKRALIERIKSKNGRFFNSIIPDVYSAIAIASTIDSYISTKLTFTIEGGSHHSNVKLWSMRRKDGQIPAFYTEGDLRFHSSLGDGFVPSLSLLVYESYIQSAHLREKNPHINPREQLAQAIMLAKNSNKSDVIDYCREVAANNNIDFESLLKSIRFKLIGRRISQGIYKNTLKVLKNKQQHIEVKSDQLTNIDQAASEAHRLIYPA